MFVMNSWELKLPFTINYQGQQFIIPYDNIWHEVPDGCATPKGTKGYLRCAIANPIAPPQSLPSILEIDLSKIGIYDSEKYEREISNEQQLTETKTYEVSPTIKTNAEETLRRENEIESKTKDNPDSQETQTTIQRSNERKEITETRSNQESLEELLDSQTTEEVIDNRPKHVRNRGIKSRIGKKKHHLKVSTSADQSEKK
jgi:hypothetical protein